MNNEIDLHGENRVTALILLNEFLNDMIKLGISDVKIIHGIGSGIIRKVVLNYLHSDSRIVEYRIDFFNEGMTDAVLKLDKNV